MYTRDSNPIPLLIRAYKKVFIWYFPYLLFIYVLYEFVGIEELDIKMSIATVLGVSIALLLGFRTASAYERWWEARKIWGAIVNDSRTLVRQLITFTNPNQIPSEAKRIAGLQIAWIYSLKNSLRGENPLSESQKYLSDGDVEKIRESSNKPNEILKLIGIELNKMKISAYIDSYQFISLDHTVKNLCDHMGKSERIRNTVFPIQYASFAKVGVILFVFMLPYGMLFSTGPFMILICLLVSFFFIMIETVAHYLQDPFHNRPSDTPMSALCRTIEINILELIEENEKPEPLTPDDEGVLM